jgi:hypothetical protein
MGLMIFTALAGWLSIGIFKNSLKSRQRFSHDLYIIGYLPFHFAPNASSASCPAFPAAAE